MPDSDLLRRKLERALKARKMAEQILEQKALELFDANQLLKTANDKLAGEVAQKSDQLVERDQRFKTFIDGASDSIYNFTEELNFIYVNEKTEELLGYSKQELLSMTVAELVHPDYLEMATLFFTDFLDKSKKSDYIEFPVVNKNNEIIWAGTNVTHVDDESGVYYSAISRNITERKKIEKDLGHAREHLEKSEHKYRGILQNLELGILELNNDRRITYSNLIFQNMIGYDEEELLGAIPANLFLHPQDGPLKNSAPVIEQSQESTIYDVRLIKKDGSVLNVLISKSLVYSLSGEITGSIAIHYDITERKLLETELLKAKEIAENTQKEQQKFLAVMSHEIRTPLNSIVGMSHLLSDTTITNEQKEYIELINNASEMLQSLVSDILDLSKIQSGKQDLVEEDFDLIKHLGNCLSSIKIRSSDPDVILKFVHEDFETLWMRSDKKMIHQIVTNLLHNAVKFTKKGEIILKINQLSNKDMIRLSVSDTGIGIAEDKLKLIFKEFEQANDNIHGVYGGTGLGLSICQKLASALGSYLQVKSALGEGATFFMDLKIKKASAKSISKSKGESSEQNLSNVSILVAEDNPMNQKYISRLLDKKMIKYQIADDGRIAAECATTAKYDLIFMDIHMPNMDGYESTREIRSRGLNIDTPIIALSASTLLSQKEEAINSGMQDFLSKPFNPTQLYTVIEQYGANILNQEEVASLSVDNKIDKDAVKQFYGDDKEYMQDMFQLFVDQIAKDIFDLEQAYSDGNLNSIRQVCHKIKPTYQMVGLVNMADLVKNIECRAGEEDKSILKEKSDVILLLNDGIDIIKKEIIKLQSEN